MKALVIGFGSIGARHANILKDLNCEVSVVTKQNIDTYSKFVSIKQALEFKNFDYVVVANKTNEHYTSLRELEESNYSGVILVEKPLFDCYYAYQPNSISNIYVAYNLRFHPLIMKLRSLLINDPVISCQAYVGQHLPQWRPKRDYRKTYSAKSSEGGGVLLDLSHELDYLSWIFGPWKRLTALGGKLSDLEIDCEDVVSVLMETEKCPILSLQMNYLDRIPKREIIVNTNQSSIHIDLIKGNIKTNGEIENFKIDRNYTYKKQHLAIINNDNQNLCSFGEGQVVIDQIQAINESISHHKGVWINL